MLFARLLRPFITLGTLHIVDASGRVHTLTGREPGPEVTMRVHSRRSQLRLLWRPALAVGEAYMDGDLTVEGGDLYPLMDLINRNIFRAGYNPLSQLQRILTWPLRLLPAANSLKRARRNAAYTYDLDVAFYRLFLDKHMQYTCGYFRKGNETLEEAQEEKMLHLASKLLLKPGMKVLEIGCGWGNLAVFLTGLEVVTVHGLTLSSEQLQDAERLARKNGVASRARFSLRDYRHEHGQYDRIISVGMLEHVGVRHYRAYFKQVHDLLTEDGVAVVHFIGHMDRPCGNAPWLNKYIFPGGYTPALSEVMRRFGTAAAVRHRHRSVAPALSTDAGRLATAPACQLGSGQRPVWGKFLPDVGFLSCQFRSRTPPGHFRRISTAVGAAHGCCAADPRLHRAVEGCPSARSTWRANTHHQSKLIVATTAAPDYLRAGSAR